MLTYTLDEKLSLRMLRPNDADALFAVLEANRDYLRQWLSWLDTTTQVEHCRTFIMSTLEQCGKNNGYVCAILWEGALVGTIGYNHIEWDSRSSTLGYWLSQTHQGQGIVTRCCRTLIDYAFQEFKLNKVTIMVATENHKSRSIPERLGFQYDGILREAQWLYDHYIDHAIYSMLAREWKD